MDIEWIGRYIDFSYLKIEREKERKKEGKGERENLQTSLTKCYEITENYKHAIKVYLSGNKFINLPQSE
jgi:hypothetical protein